MPHEPVVLVLAATLIILRVLCTKPLLDQIHSGALSNSHMRNPLQAEGLVKNMRVQASRYTGSYRMLAE
jgi:hypothetical protein